MHHHTNIHGLEEKKQYETPHPHLERLTTLVYSLRPLLSVARQQLLHPMQGAEDAATPIAAQFVWLWLADRERRDKRQHNTYGLVPW